MTKINVVQFIKHTNYVLSVMCCVAKSSQNESYCSSFHAKTQPFVDAPNITVIPSPVRNCPNINT